MMAGMIDRILVSRLSEYIDSWQKLGLGPKIDVEKFAQVSEFIDEYSGNRDMKYHYGRIRFFKNEFLAGKTVPPIILDNQCFGGHISAWPVIIDGHHRFYGAVLAGAKYINASYSGRTDLLNYLKDKRKTKPEF